VIEEDRKLNINRCSYVEGSIDDDDYDFYNKNIINNDGYDKNRIDGGGYNGYDKNRN
jgi:hypothetical protein